MFDMFKSIVEKRNQNCAIPGKKSFKIQNPCFGKFFFRLYTPDTSLNVNTFDYLLLLFLLLLIQLNEGKEKLSRRLMRPKLLLQPGQMSKNRIDIGIPALLCGKRFVTFCTEMNLVNHFVAGRLGY